MQMTQGLHVSLVNKVLCVVQLNIAAMAEERRIRVLQKNKATTH